MARMKRVPLAGVVSLGCSDDAAVASHEAHGVIAFLKKPYNLEELLGKLDAALT